MQFIQKVKGSNIYQEGLRWRLLRNLCYEERNRSQQQIENGQFSRLIYFIMKIKRECLGPFEENVHIR